MKIILYSSPCRVLKTRSSNWDFTEDIPSLWANGEYTSLVSIAILRCFNFGKNSIVFILCNLSANLIIITLISFATDRSIFIKLPACFSFLVENSIPLIFVNPSTKPAKSLSNSISRSFIVMFVSSTTSCNSPAIIVL